MPKINKKRIVFDERNIKIFAERIISLRKEKEISQESLGKYLGFSRSTISCYENGLRAPDMKTLTVYSEFFDVPVDYLLGKTDIKKPLYRVACFSDISDKEFGKISKSGQEEIKSYIQFIMNKEKIKK